MLKPEHIKVPVLPPNAHLRQRLPRRRLGAGAGRRQMERVRHHAARRRPAPLQRDQAHGRRHLAADADPDAARTGARRPGDAHGVPDHSAARRLRTDRSRTRAVRSRWRRWACGRTSISRKSKARGRGSTAQRGADRELSEHCQISDTSPPPWRSSRPASSSSSSTVRTIAGEVPAIRIRSSSRSGLVRAD